MSDVVVEGTPGGVRDQRPQKIEDVERGGFSGIVMLLAGFLSVLVCVYFIAVGIGHGVDYRFVDPVWPFFAYAALSFVALIFFFAGLKTVGPNKAAVVTLFGRYVGTIRVSGFYWLNPFCDATDVSLAVAVLEGAEVKVNDLNGNPIEVSVVVTWSVVDPAQATFGVADYAAYVSRQSETATRGVIAAHPYEAHHDLDEGKEPPLRPKAGEAAAVNLLGHDKEVSQELATALDRLCRPIGVAIHTVSIARLSYATEIAPEMLQRQKAHARLGAQRVILKNAIGIVREVVDELQAPAKPGGERQPIEPHVRATVMSNLLIVMLSGQQAAPVFPVGQP